MPYSGAAWFRAVPIVRFEAPEPGSTDRLGAELGTKRRCRACARPILGGLQLRGAMVLYAALHGPVLGRMPRTRRAKP
jgi:hypothetical protein